jgi:outer membrane protein assembly factor BamB
LLSNKLLLKFFLATAGFLLAGCGVGATQMWPGVASDGQVVYVAQGQQVHAVNLTTQRAAWSFPVAPGNQTGMFVSDPAIGDGIIVVGSEGPTGSYSGVLYGLDPANGQRRWCLAFDRRGVDREGCPIAQGRQAEGFLGLTGAVDNRIIGGLAIDDNVVYFGLANGTVYAVDATTGTDLWHFEAQRDVWATPLVNGRAVYVASLDHNLYALNRADGQLIWQRNLGGALAGTPLLIDDTLYIGTFGDRMFALQTSNGQDRWAPFETTNWIWSGPAERDGMLYFTDVAGFVYAIDADSGTEVWRQRPGVQMRARPAVTEDTVFVGDRDGNLYALNRADGTTRWTQNMRGQLLVSPVVANDQVIVAPFNGDNLLAAYSAATGDFQWPFAPSK